MKDLTFDAYAKIYDAFYTDKDYQQECINLIKIAKSITSTLNCGLEIGAGTGAFTKELAKLVKHIEAYEISENMAKICASNLESLVDIKVTNGDLSDILESTLVKNSVDIVIANFHVFSYFSLDEINMFVQICRKLLRSGGVVCFDFWDLHAVVLNPPKKVIKVAHYLNREIERRAVPKISEDFREIDVVFEFYESSYLLFKESHVMYPKTLAEVIGYFGDSYEYHGSYDISSGEMYSEKSYGRLVYFQKL